MFHHLVAVSPRHVDAAMAKSTPATTARRPIRCYFCGNRFEVSLRTMSVPCPKCNKALKVEDITVKSYLPVNDLQTCGRITIAKNGRVVAKVIRSGDGIDCEGTLEGALETDGPIVLGEKASWKGKSLMCKSIAIAEGAKLVGYMKIPWQRPEPESRERAVASNPNGEAAIDTP
jgi:hypothetical protein